VKFEMLNLIYLAAKNDGIWRCMGLVNLNVSTLSIIIDQIQTSPSIVVQI
jgi:hypothetical protein